MFVTKNAMPKINSKEPKVAESFFDIKPKIPLFFEWLLEYI